MSDREVKTKQTFEEWWGPNRGAEYDWAKRGWNAALASVILPEGDWAEELSKLVPWDKVRSTNVVICAYDQTGAQVAVFGKINRPVPKTVELTVEEKLNDLFVKLHGDDPHALAWYTISVNLANGKTLDHLCSEYGVSTTKELS